MRPLDVTRAALDSKQAAVASFRLPNKMNTDKAIVNFAVMWTDMLTRLMTTITTAAGMSLLALSPPC